MGVGRRYCQDCVRHEAEGLLWNNPCQNCHVQQFLQRALLNLLQMPVSLSNYSMLFLVFWFLVFKLLPLSASAHKDGPIKLFCRFFFLLIFRPLFPPATVLWWCLCPSSIWLYVISSCCLWMISMAICLHFKHSLIVLFKLTLSPCDLSWFWFWSDCDCDCDCDSDMCMTLILICSR